MEAFSMASMTDVIFLLLIFFMVTSTYVFPTALEVNLPQSTQQTTLKPTVRIYLDKDGNLATVKGDGIPEPMSREELTVWLRLAIEDDPEPAVALYADEELPYGKIVEILNLGASVNVKIVLATKPSERPIAPTDGATGPEVTENPETQPL